MAASGGSGQNQYKTLQEIVLAAHANLPAEIWDYVTYGSESETTVCRNRFALDSLAFCPRILRNVSEIDPSTTLLGQRLRIPVLLAPMGSIARFDREGALASARAVAEFGTMQIVASHAVEEIASITGRGPLPLIYALHPHGDLPELLEEVDRVADAGFRAISFATQSAPYSRRERDVMHNLLGKGQSTRSYADYLAQQRREREAGQEPSKEGLKRIMLSWELLGRVKERSRLPLILKGVQTAADAKLAVEHGVDVLYVSNNGGRALDHARATIDALRDVAGVAKGRAEVIADGGFVRGSDIIKALALGARAVSVGRLQAWSLAAAGTAGVVRMLEILEEELIVNMGLLGVNRPDELDPQYLSAVVPCTRAHPLSAFPVVMERLFAGNNPRNLETAE